METQVKLLFLTLFSITFVRGQHWTHHLVLDQHGNYHVWWFVERDVITFQVEVATKGWIGFGLSPNGGMPGSDVVIGWVKNGKPQLHDRYAEGKFMPIIDRKQDWNIIWSNENDTHTTLRFKRSLNTCDNHDLPITNETTRLLYAYHPDDPSSADRVMYHGSTRRGTKSVLLLRAEERHRDWKTQNVRQFDATARNVRIPDDTDTAYYCTFIKAPQLQRKHHVIRMEPIIQPGNERLVHHMILYKCIDTPESKIEPYLEKEFHECYTELQVPRFTFCLYVVSGWAIGGGAFDFPEQAGMEIGEPNTSYFMLEIHYDNPGLTQGIVDNSGMKLLYTDRLRQYDSAAITFGTMTYACVFVPPKQKEFIVSGHAHPACLRQKIPKEGLKVFGVILHSHLLGRRITVRHFRDNEELPPLASDKSYDFNFQEFRSFPEERIILPNDHLITECTYDSSERTLPTFGGLGTQEEMCLGIFFYYPKVSLSLAVSCPSPHNLVRAVGVTEISDNDQFVISPITGRNETYVDFLDSYPWDSYSVKAVQKAMRYSPHINLCVEEGSKIAWVLLLSRYPKVEKKYKEYDVCTRR